jgi:hypothetical protein
LLLPVPAVILNAEKDPEETTRQPPCETFQPIPSPRLPLPSLCLLAVILRQRRRIYFCLCIRPTLPSKESHHLTAISSHPAN